MVSSIEPTSTAKMISAPRDFMCATVRLSTYPPSRSICPSSQSGGRRPARDMEARMYRQAYPLVWISMRDLDIEVELQ